jgi:hypothetical protein
MPDDVTPMGSRQYNQIESARLNYVHTLEEQLQHCGWTKCYRKKNNFYYWCKLVPGDGWVTAITAEDALKWEYEL